MDKELGKGSIHRESSDSVSEGGSTGKRCVMAGGTEVDGFLPAGGR